MNMPPMMAHTPVRKCVKDLAEGWGGGQPAPLLPAIPGPSLPPPSPVLLCQLHHHGRQLIQHEDSGKPLVAHQPIGDLLVSGHRELICPQHLGQEGSLGRGRGCDLAPNPLSPTPAPALVRSARTVWERKRGPRLLMNTARPGGHPDTLSASPPRLLVPIPATRGGSSQRGFRDGKHLAKAAP